jgi:hypothetical protein
MMGFVMRGLSGRLVVGSLPVADFGPWEAEALAGPRRLRVGARTTDWDPVGKHRLTDPGLTVELEVGSRVTTGRATVSRQDPLYLVVEEYDG